MELQQPPAIMAPKMSPQSVASVHHSLMCCPMELQQPPAFMARTDCSPVVQSIHILRDQARHPAAGEEAGEAIMSSVGGAAGERGPA